LTGSGNILINGAYSAGSGASGLTYAGTGTLTLTANDGYTGATNLNSGATVISGAAGELSGTSGVTVTAGASLTLDNYAGGTGTNLNNRLGGRPLTLQGGAFTLNGGSAGTTETAGALTLNSGASTIALTNNGGTNVLTFASLTFGVGGTINFGAGLGLATNEILFSTVPALSPATTGILADATVNGADFATYGANGITAFSNYTTETTINSAAATNTVLVTSNANLTASATINALKISGGGLTVAGTGAFTLTVTSGGVLVTGGTDTLSIPYIVFGAPATEGALQVNTGATLDLSSVITSTQTGGLVKGLGGNLEILSQQFYTGTTTLNGGTTQLASGVTNTLFAGQSLAVNLGATLDLDGNIQYAGALSSGGILPNTGGTITNSSLTTTTFVASETGSTTWAGNITGNLNFVRANGSTLTVESDNTYTGATLLTGGTTRMTAG
jgi:X-X-X-Leu-X-X-Gly heptad repeat protein/autotransporter-associated beta strand protein